MKRRLWSLVFALWSLVMTFGLAEAQINMPDPSLIAGKALPAPELPNGTVSVRVVREGLGNNIVGQEVTVTAGSTTKKGSSDEQGRAQMVGFPAGASGTATTTVDGEALTSDPFEVPAAGGIRIILISGLKELAARKAKEAAEEAALPPIKGVVTFGADSRVVMEIQNDELQVFYILQIINSARARVDIGGPLIIQLPEGASGATVMQGSSPNAVAQGDRILVTGPFPAGMTNVEIAYALPHDSSELTLRQTWPAALAQILVIIEKVGTLTMSSSQFTEQDESRAQNGTVFMLAGNPQGIPAGGELAVQLSGLPYTSSVPKEVAIALAVLVLAVGAWAAMSGTAGDESGRRLKERRESLYGELVKLEEQRQAGRVDGSKYAARRQRLLADLERVYGELDGTSPGRQGGGEAAA